MSFFNDNSKFGLIYLILGIITIVVGILSAISGALTEEGEKISFALILGGVGSVIYGFLITKAAAKIRSGEIASKFEIIILLITMIAIGTFISSILGGIGTAIDGDIGSGVFTIIIGIIIVLILGFVLKKLQDGKNGILDKIIWILMILIALFTLVAGILEMIGAIGVGDALSLVVGLIDGFCTFFVGVFVLLALFDDGVKKEIGI